MLACRSFAFVCRLVVVVVMASCKPPSNLGPKLSFVMAGQGDVAALVSVERQQAIAANKRLIVYVGAGWCEPCARFHSVATQGALDATLPSIVFLEFDLDRDQERLEAAGYKSRYIPLFAVPLANGRASGKQIAGARKNADASEEVTPRLLQLLAETRDL